MITIKLISILLLLVVLALDVAFIVFLTKITLETLIGGSVHGSLRPEAKVILPIAFVICVSIAGFCGFWIYKLTQSLRASVDFSFGDVVNVAKYVLKYVHQQMQYLIQQIQSNSIFIFEFYFKASLFITIFSIITLIPFALVLMSGSQRGMAGAAGFQIASVGISIALINSCVATFLARYNNVDNAWVGPSIFIHGLLLVLALVFFASLLYSRFSD